MDASANTYAGGISFHPAVAGNIDSVFDASSGLHFDLPMAALQTVQNNSLNFTTANTGMDFSFLGQVIGSGQSALGAAVVQNTGVNLAAVNAGYGVGIANVNLASAIDANATGAADYVASLQSSLAKYLSDNATKVALGAQGSQTAQVQIQNKGKSTGNIIGKLLSGGLF